MYNANSISSYVINWCNSHNIDITNLKLQKLLYFLQGNFYRLTGLQLIDDDFYAWQLGPVIPHVYEKFAIYSAYSIPKQKREPIDQNDECNCDLILKKYAKKSAWQLVEMSHHEDPWKYSYNIFGDKSKIPFSSIMEYYGRST